MDDLLSLSPSITTLSLGIVVSTLTTAASSPHLSNKCTRVRFELQEKADQSIDKVFGLN